MLADIFQPRCGSGHLIKAIKWKNVNVDIDSHGVLFLSGWIYRAAKVS